MNAKVVPIRFEKPSTKREVLFLDVENEELDLLVQTDGGKIPFVEWLEKRYEEAYVSGFKKASYLHMAILVLAMCVVITIYLITFHYQTEVIRDQERIIGEHEFLLLHSSLDLDTFLVFNP